MLKKAIAVLGALSLTASLSACAFTETTTKEVTRITEVPEKMLFIGDSIAAGYGLEGYSFEDKYKCRSYPNILKDKYDAELGSENKMVNKAVPGDTSQDLIDLLRSGELDADLKEADAVVVSIGGNDLLGILLKLLDSLGVDEQGKIDIGSINIFTAATAVLSMEGEVDAALDKFEINIGTISEELLKRTDGTVYLQTLYDPLEYYSKYKTVTKFADEKLGRLNSIITENASRGYTVIDVAPDFAGKAEELTNISSFDIHPNAAGHEVIAADVDAAFRETKFTYTATEDGEKKLTTEGKMAVVGGIAGIVAVVGAAAVIILINKKKPGKE